MQQKKYVQICNDKNKAITLTSRMFASWDGNYLDVTKYVIPPEQTHLIFLSELNRRKIGYVGEDRQGNRIYSIHGKSITLLSNAHTLDRGVGFYLFSCFRPNQTHLKQNGRRFSPGTKFFTLTTIDRHGVLTDSKIRKLHPIECERLQTLPDNFSAGVSDSQRYRALGNGWTVDVIVHLLKSLMNNAI